MDRNLQVEMHRTAIPERKHSSRKEYVTDLVSVGGFNTPKVVFWGWIDREGNHARLGCRFGDHLLFEQPNNSITVVGDRLHKAH